MTLGWFPHVIKTEYYDYIAMVLLETDSKSVKIPKGQSKVLTRRTDNTVVNRKRYAMVYKTLRIKQHKSITI